MTDRLKLLGFSDFSSLLKFDFPWSFGVELFPLQFKIQLSCYQLS